ncbi:MAG: hypothetical protein RLZZ591_542 [Pseudomonadota bacterium]|jgi:arylformamidase
MTQPDPQWLDRMYNNRALVPDFALHFAKWVEESVQARESLSGEQDVVYGPDASDVMDIFVPDHPTSGGAPVVVFIHGGYWRSLDKSDHSFVARRLVSEGACVVVPNYALCPAVTLPDIALQMVRALAWVWRHIADYGGDPERITVVGHSAGGHLAAMLLACNWKSYARDLPHRLVRNALSISGLFELESIRRTPFLQASLHLTPAQVRKCSPAWMPKPGVQRGRGHLYGVVGGDESAEFLRQNALIRSAWGAQVVPVCEALPGLNHFSILSALTQPGHRLHGLVNELVFD